MAQLKQTSITGSLIVSGSSIIMPNLTASVDSGSSGQLWIDDSPGLRMKYTCAGSFGSVNSPFTTLGAFSVGTALSNGRYGGAGFGTQQAAAYAGGNGKSNLTEEWNGSAWSAGGAMIISRNNNAGAGTQNAGLTYGGEAPGDSTTRATEEYNGSSWATGGDLGDAVQRGGGSTAGTQFAATLSGGEDGGSKNRTFEYDGAAWTAGPNINTGRRAMGTTGGTQTTAFIGGADDTTTGYCMEMYDGVAWANQNRLPESRRYGAKGTGTQNDAIMSHGASGTPVASYYSQARRWDGISWSADRTVNFNRVRAGAAGTSNDGMVIGGFCNASPYNLACVEEYNQTFLPVFNYSAWSQTANLINARKEAGGTGTQNAALVAGSPSLTEEYDGSAWTAGGALINARTLGMFAFGTQNAAALAGGYPGSDPGATVTEEYGGSSWSAGGAMITGRYASNNASGGTQNAGVIFGGFNAPNSVSCIEEYNGSSWASGGAMIQGRRQIGGAGIQNSALAAGGQGPSPSYTLYTCHEQYNGTAWSAATALPTAIESSATSGDDADNVLLTAGSDCGNAQNSIFCSSTWNGTSWSNEGSLNTKRHAGQRAGGSTSALVAGGATNSGDQSFGNVPNTEAFTTTCLSSINACANTWTAIAGLLNNGGYRGGWGTVNAAAVAGGAPDGDATEEYNGTAWSAGGNKINGGVGMAVANAAAQDAGMFGGLADPYRACTEEYNGSTWAAGGATNIVIGYRGGAGTQNAGLAIGGYMNAPLGAEGCVEEYNGSSWSNATAVPGYQQYEIPATGTQNDAVIAGGASNPPSINNHCATQHYDGSSWSAGGNLNVGRQSSDTMAGTSNTAIIVAGRTPTYINNVEHYDGTAWSIGFKYPIKNQGGATLGSSNSAMQAGGRTPDDTYHNVAYVNTCSVYCGGTWSIGNSLNTSRFHLGGAGTQNAALAFGGATPSYSSATEEYNGSTWSSSSAINSARGNAASNGTATAAVYAGGGPGKKTDSEDWDGSSWSTGNALIFGRRRITGLGGTGSQNAGLAWAGYAPPTSPSNFVNCVEEYDGSSWSAGGGLITKNSKPGGAGTQNAAISMGGQTPSGIANNVEFYNGSSWASGDPIISARSTGVGSGTQNAAFLAGGLKDSDYTTSDTEEYNGVTFSIIGSLPTILHGGSGAGASSSDSMTFGGATLNPPGSSQIIGDTYIWNCDPVRRGAFCFSKTI